MGEEKGESPKSMRALAWAGWSSVFVLVFAGIGESAKTWVSDKLKANGTLDAAWTWLTTPIVGHSPFAWLFLASIAVACGSAGVYLWRWYQRTYRDLDHMVWHGLRWEWHRDAGNLVLSTVTVRCPCAREIAPTVTDGTIGLRCEVCGTTCDLAGHGHAIATIPDLAALAARERDHRMRRWKSGQHYRHWADVAKDSTHRPRPTTSFTQPIAGAPAQAVGADADVRIPISADPMIAHGQIQRQRTLAAHIMERHFPDLADRRMVPQADILRTGTDAGWPLDEVKAALTLLVETGRLARSGTKGGIRYHSAHNEVDWRAEFHGMRWRGVDWTWRVSTAGDPEDIKVTCPKCSTPLYPSNASGYDAVPLIVLTCDHCRQHIGPPFNGDGDALLIRMQAEMQRRINVCEKGGYADAKAMAVDDHQPIDYPKVTTAREIAAAATVPQPPVMPVLSGDQLVHAKQAAQAFQAHDLLIRAFGGKPAFTILTTVEIQEKLRGTGRSEEAIAASLKLLQADGLVTILDRFSCKQVIPTEAGQKIVDDRLGVPESVRVAARAARMAAYRVGEQPPAKVLPDASEQALTREILRHAFMGGNVGKPVFKDAAIAVMKTVGYEVPDVERVLSLMEAKNLVATITSATNGTTQISLTPAGEKRAKAGT